MLKLKTEYVAYVLWTALSTRVPHFCLRIYWALTFHERVTDQGHDSFVFILHAENSRKEFINKLGCSTRRTCCTYVNVSHPRPTCWPSITTLNNNENSGLTYRHSELMCVLFWNAFHEFRSLALVKEHFLTVLWNKNRRNLNFLPQRNPNAFRIWFRIWIRIGYKMESQKLKKWDTTYWATMLLLTLKNQDFVQNLLFKKLC